MPSAVGSYIDDGLAVCSCTLSAQAKTVLAAYLFYLRVKKKHWSVWEVKGGGASLVPLSSRSTQGRAPLWEASPVACEKNARKSPVVIQAVQCRAIYLFGIIKLHKRFWGVFEVWCLPPYSINFGQLRTFWHRHSVMNEPLIWFIALKDWILFRSMSDSHA